ncbi:MAG: glycosyltransferase [Bacteroidales bacterium]|nr:glycosyltransferase [Bacteroidales bacterium]
MEPRPVLSVLMPVYNGREFLKPAIDSILAQTYRDFELIIVNDGSTDDTQAVIDSYKDPRIVATVQKNQGVARSLNNGLDVARGTYVRRHDADDVSTPDSFRIQIDFLESHPEYVMVCNQQAFMTARGRIAWKYRVPNNDFFHGQDFTDLGFEHFTVDKSSPVVHGTACFRREAVIAMGKYRTEFTVSEDNDLWLRLLEKYKIAVLNRCTYFMRLHGTSATQRHAGKIKHFRNLLIDFSRQRRETGTDPIMRGEPVPPPPSTAPADDVPTTQARGKKFREDLRYIYGLSVNARDGELIRKYGGAILRDGWRDLRSWKMLLFPVLGDSLVKFGVSLKSRFKSTASR